MKVNVRTKINKGKLQQISKNAEKALIETAEAIKTDLYQSQTMPFDTGNMQNKSTFVDDTQSKNGVVKLITDTPYARKMYFHPEYNFQTKENANARGNWYEPWISGKEKNFCSKAFSQFYKKEAGL